MSFDKTYFSPTITYETYELPSSVALIISDDKLVVEEGGIRLLEAAMNINLGMDLDYVYESSDETIAKVLDNGLIYALKEGVAVITVSVNDGEFSEQCTVEVVSAESGESSGCGCKGEIQTGNLLIIAFVSIAVVGIFGLRKKIK